MRYKLKTFVLTSSVAAFSLGILALIGWVSGWRILAGGIYGYSLMSPNSALVFITMGLSCFLLAIRPDRYLFRDLASMTSVLSMLVGTVNLAEVFLRHKHISHHWLSQAIRHPSITDSGSISPVTAGVFILAGCALSLYIKSRKASCGILGSATIATGWVIFMGYLFGLPVLYGGTIDPVSLPTSLAIIFLGMALTGLAGTDVWPLKDLTGSSTAALILRPLLPTIILLILIQNWLFVNIFGEANSLDILQSALATILAVVATYVAVLLMSKHVALKIDRAEIARRKAENHLHLARQHILAHIDNSPLAVVEFDPGFRIIRWTQSAERIFGWTPDEVLGKTIPELRWVHEEDSESVRQVSSEMLSGSRIRNMNSNRNYRKDGSTIHCDWYNSAIYDEQGRLASILSFVLDTTEHKRASEEILILNEQLERRVRERTAELEEINRELESFSYSVSHDLRAPLRSIDGFSLALYEEYRDRLDKTGNDYLMRVRTATRHMERLIDDLLNLSRVSRADMLFNATDLSRIAAGILETLGRENPDRKVETIVQENIVASGDPSLIRIVLENILANAWKFTARNHKARIEFGGTEMNGEYVYYIRDNGVGFDMAYAGKLFGAFQRLHGKDDFPGTGVGLAIVQRIIHRHGGRVWAESEKGAGSTFYFTLNTEEGRGKVEEKTPASYS